MSLLSIKFLLIDNFCSGSKEDKDSRNVNFYLNKKLYNLVI